MSPLAGTCLVFTPLPLVPAFPIGAALFQGLAACKSPAVGQVSAPPSLKALTSPASLPLRASSQFSGVTGLLQTLVKFCSMWVQPLSKGKSGAQIPALSGGRLSRRTSSLFCERSLQEVSAKASASARLEVHSIIMAFSWAGLTM